MKRIVPIIIIAMVIFLMGILAARFWLQPSSTQTSQERKISYWKAPMEAGYRSDKPGKSPMGMDLIPVYQDEQTIGNSTIKISPAVENNLGVKTARVENRSLSRMISTVGYVTTDEHNIERIHTYTEGWIKVLRVKTTGEHVNKGQLLLELFSPSLVNAQEEFLLASKNNNTALTTASEKKLLTLGMGQTQINQLRRSHKVMQRVKIFSTQGGVVSRLSIREGNFVKPATDIMTIEDLSHIWMIAEVFERQANWVKQGQPAVATLPYLPGKVWQGKIDYVYPHLDQKTHTIRVRLTFPNPDLAIKPNMYADIKIMSAMIKNALAIPRSAIIYTGQGSHVVLAVGDGHYKAQSVRLGIESGNYMQILSGLKAGQRVVTSAQFLIDSETNIKASFERMTDDASSKQTQTDVSPQQFVGMGKVKVIDLKTRTLSLFHQPMPDLDMPTMTMHLIVAKDIDLSKVKAGDEVHFIMIKQTNNQYLVTKLHVMKSSQPSE